MSGLTLHCCRHSYDDLLVQLDPVHKDVVVQVTQDEVMGTVCLSHKDARTLAEFILLQLPSEQTNEH